MSAFDSNVASSLSPTSAGWCHEKLLDFSKNLITNIQLKSAKRSEILLPGALTSYDARAWISQHSVFALTKTVALTVETLVIFHLFLCFATSRAWLKYQQLRCHTFSSIGYCFFCSTFCALLHQDYLSNWPQSQRFLIFFSETQKNK